jgi:hypothetical protein
MPCHCGPTSCERCTCRPAESTACPSIVPTQTWVSLSVPAYAVQEMGEEWIRARAATVPFRIPFSERRAAIKAARSREDHAHPDARREASEAGSTHHHNEASKRCER